MKSLDHYLSNLSFRSLLKGVFFGLILLMSVLSVSAQQSYHQHFFSPNQGQVLKTNNQVCDQTLYKISLAHYEVFLRKGGMRYVLRRPEGGDTLVLYRLELLLEGCDTNAMVQGLDAEFHKSHFYHPAYINGITNIPNYRKVKYTNIYPNIDWVIYTDSSGQNLKYDFIVHPGGNPALIRLKYAYASSVTCRLSGELAIGSPLGTIIEHRPYTYQPIQNSPQVDSVSCQYSCSDTTVTFSFGTYDTNRDLIIDPQISTPIVYDVNDDEHLEAFLIDGQNNKYLAGYLSPSLLSTAGMPTTVLGAKDAFVAKFDSSGTLLWDLFLGGTGADEAKAIAVDANGNVTIGGSSNSADFPVKFPYQNTLAGSSDAVVFQTASNGILNWSTYYGGNGTEQINRMLTLPGGSILVVGGTSSSNLPTTTNSPAGGQDGFLAQMNGSGFPQWARYVGGSGPDELNTIHYGSNNILGVGGATNSTDLPISQNALQSQNQGGQELFLAQMDVNSGQTQWMTYFGGSGDEVIRDLKVDTTGFTFCGSTTSTSLFPLVNAAQNTYGGGATDAFYARISLDGTTTRVSSYQGGNGTDIYNSVNTLTHQNTTVFTGSSNSTDLTYPLPCDEEPPPVDPPGSYIPIIGELGTGNVLNPFRMVNVGGGEATNGESATDGIGVIFITVVTPDGVKVIRIPTLEPCPCDIDLIQAPPLACNCDDMDEPSGISFSFMLPANLEQQLNGNNCNQLSVSFPFELSGDVSADDIAFDPVNMAGGGSIAERIAKTYADMPGVISTKTDNNLLTIRLDSELYGDWCNANNEVVTKMVAVEPGSGPLPIGPDGQPLEATSYLYVQCKKGIELQIKIRLCECEVISPKINVCCKSTTTLDQPQLTDCSPQTSVITTCSPDAINASDIEYLTLDRAGVNLTCLTAVKYFDPTFKTETQQVGVNVLHGNLLPCRNIDFRSYPLNEDIIPATRLNKLGICLGNPSQGYCLSRITKNYAAYLGNTICGGYSLKAGLDKKPHKIRYKLKWSNNPQSLICSEKGPTPKAGFLSFKVGINGGNELFLNEQDREYRCCSPETTRKVESRGPVQTSFIIKLPPVPLDCKTNPPKIKVKLILPPQGESTEWKSMCSDELTDTWVSNGMPLSHAVYLALLNLVNKPENQNPRTFSSITHDPLSGMITVQTDPNFCDQDVKNFRLIVELCGGSPCQEFPPPHNQFPSFPLPGGSVGKLTNRLSFPVTICCGKGGLCTCGQGYNSIRASFALNSNNIPIQCSKLSLTLPFVPGIQVEDFDPAVELDPRTQLNEVNTLAQRLATELQGKVAGVSIMGNARNVLTFEFDRDLFQDLCVVPPGSNNINNCYASQQRLQIKLNYCGVEKLIDPSAVCCPFKLKVQPNRTCDPSEGEPEGEPLPPNQATCPDYQYAFGTVKFLPADKLSTLANALVPCSTTTISYTKPKFTSSSGGGGCDFFGHPNQPVTLALDHLNPSVTLPCTFIAPNGSIQDLTLDQKINRMIRTYAYHVQTLSGESYFKASYDPFHANQMRYALKWPKAGCPCNGPSKSGFLALEVKIVGIDINPLRLEYVDSYECCDDSNPFNNLLYGLDPKEHCLCCDD